LAAGEGTWWEYAALPAAAIAVASRWSVGGNAANKIAFVACSDPEKRVLSFEGRRQALELGTVLLKVSCPERSLARLEAALVSLIEKTPRRR
jgi:hypothetical protein